MYDISCTIVILTFTIKTNTMGPYQGLSLKEQSDMGLYIILYNNSFQLMTKQRFIVNRQERFNKAFYAPKGTLGGI